VVTAALAIALLAAALAPAAHAQEDSGGVADRLDELSAHVERANRINTILYVVSFAVGAGLACIAIYATCRNTTRLDRQLRNYEERTRLLREDIDVGFTPILMWTLAGKRFGEPAPEGLGGRLVVVRIVNAGRAPAMRATAVVRHMLRAAGGGFGVIRRERHSWGAVLPNDFVEVPVWIDDEVLGAVKGPKEAFRADIALEYRSVTGKSHRRRISVRYNGKDVILRDVATGDWRRDIGLDGG